MYNHLHMNLLKAGLVRSRGVGTAGRAAAKLRGRGRSRGRGRARQQQPVVNSTAVNRQVPDANEHNNLNHLYDGKDLPQQPSQNIQGPLDLVKRSDVSHEHQRIYYDFTSNNSQERFDRDQETGNQLHLNLELQRNFGIQDGVNHPLNLATPKMPPFSVPQRADHRIGFVRKMPETALCRNDVHPGQANQNGGKPTDFAFFQEPHRHRRYAPNVGVAFVKEIVDCIFPDLAYRPLAVERDEYLEVTRKEATLLPGMSRGEERAAFCPCHPARILVSPEGRVEFQSANRTLCTVEALSAGGDSTVWRKSVLECVQNLTARSGYQFCSGLGFNPQAKCSGLSSLRCADDIMASDFGLGFRSISCVLWFRPSPESEMTTSSCWLEEEEVGEEEAQEATALFVSEKFGTCAQCLEVMQQRHRDGRRKQRNPRRMKQPSACTDSDNIIIVKRAIEFKTSVDAN